MPINPNIALGAQTPAPVNFLGQMGQMLALKAAAQDVQGGEALRDFYASGGNAGTPEGARALMAANPKMGMQILKGQSEMSARDVETQAKSLKSIKDNVSLVNSPEGMVEFLRGAYSTPGGALLAKLAPLDKAIAAIPSDPRSFADYKRNLGLTSEKLFESADAQLSSRTSLATTGMTTSATRRGQDLLENRERAKMALTAQERNVIPGENQFLQTDRFGNIYEVPAYGALRGPNAPAQPLPQAAANAFVTARPSVNALAPTAPPVVQPGSPTVANALAMEQQQNIPRPKAPYTAPVAVIDKSGNTVLMQGREAVATGATPATPATEARQIALKKLPDAIAQSRDALNLIDKMVGKEDGSTKPAPGFKGAVGTGIGLRFVPGTSESDFQAMYDQISGGAFLQAFNTLKGGGAITEKEGEKATAAITRMKLSTSEKAFMEAAREFQTVLRRGVATAQKELNSGTGGAPADPLGIR